MHKISISESGFPFKYDAYKELKSLNEWHAKHKNYIHTHLYKIHLPKFYNKDIRKLRKFSINICINNHDKCYS